MKKDKEVGMVKKVREIRDELNQKLVGKSFEDENNYIINELKSLKAKRKEILAENY